MQNGIEVFNSNVVHRVLGSFKRKSKGIFSSTFIAVRKITYSMTSEIIMIQVSVTSRGKPVKQVPPAKGQSV